MLPLTFAATVARMTDLAASRGGRLAADDVEGDVALERDRRTTSAAAHLLAAETDVVAHPADGGTGWFPYAELVFGDVRGSRLE